MRTRVKICCIASPGEARLAIEAGADALGLVGRMPSGPGQMSDSQIAEITAVTPPPIATFLLTSESTADGIAAHILATRPTAVQIVSHIAPTELARLVTIEPGVRKVQVVHVEGPDALTLNSGIWPIRPCVLIGLWSAKCLGSRIGWHRSPSQLGNQCGFCKGEPPTRVSGGWPIATECSRCHSTGPTIRGRFMFWCQNKRAFGCRKACRIYAGG